MWVEAGKKWRKMGRRRKIREGKRRGEEEKWRKKGREEGKEWRKRRKG